MKCFDRKLMFLLLVVCVAAAAASCSKAAKFAAINTDGSGFALKGFDAVAYFAVNNAVEGDQRYEFVWNGAKWLFSNAENLEKFKSDPAAYAPQFGGYCSYAVSKGYTANGDPKAWKLVNGKLYLNYNPEVKQMWEKGEQENITKGEANWIEFKSKAPQHKG